MISNSVTDVEEKLTEHLYGRVCGKGGPIDFTSRHVIQLGPSFDFLPSFICLIFLISGSGVGLAGIFLRKFAPTSHVIVAESAELVPLVKENVEQNAEAANIVVETLEWSVSSAMFDSNAHKIIILRVGRTI